MQLALGSEGKRNKEISRTHRFDRRGGGRDVALKRVYCILGLGHGQSRQVVGALRSFELGMSEPDKNQWFVVHVLSGQEQKVYENLTRRIKTEEMGDLVYEVLIPTERVSEIKRGKRTETTRKFFPGYLIVNMYLLDKQNQLVDRTWYFIRETPGVLGFAGTKDRPVPMRPQEVESMLAQIRQLEDKVKPKVSFEVGETVKVADGPFQNQSGVVEEIDPDRGKLRVSVSIFGRSTPVELEYWQVERG